LVVKSTNIKLRNMNFEPKLENIQLQLTYRAKLKFTLYIIYTCAVSFQAEYIN